MSLSFNETTLATVFCSVFKPQVYPSIRSTPGTVNLGRSSLARLLLVGLLQILQNQRMTTVSSADVCPSFA